MYSTEMSDAARLEISRKIAPSDTFVLDRMSDAARLESSRKIAPSDKTDSFDTLIEVFLAV